MERIEVNVQTGDISVVQLTQAEIEAAQNQSALWEAEQALLVKQQIATLTAELEALKAKAQLP